MIRIFLQMQSDLCLHCLSTPFWQATSVQNFRTSTVPITASLTIGITPSLSASPSWADPLPSWIFPAASFFSTISSFLGERGFCGFGGGPFLSFLPTEIHMVQPIIAHEILVLITYGPRREKTCLQGFRKREFQTSLLSYTDWLENWNFTCSKFAYATYHKANNKGADQTARMHKLVCACVVRKPPKTGFLARVPICQQ